MMSLTPRQEQAKQAIFSYMSRRKKSPTYGELARSLGITRPVAHALTRQLQRRGHVVLLSCASRGIIPIHYERRK